MSSANVDSPPYLTSDVSPTAVLIVFGTLSAVCLIWAIRCAVRSRDVAPVAVCLGALLCALNEPVFDVLGKIVYAHDHYIAYTSFGRHIPWFLVLGYLPWVGLFPYLIAQQMAAGISRARLHAISIGSFVSVVLVESLGTSLHSWGYYGAVPLKYLVVAPQMAAVPIVGGFLIFAVGDVVQGWRRILLGIIPTLALPLVYASVSWPIYFGLHSSLPSALNWVLALAMLGLTAIVVTETTRLAHGWHARWAAPLAVSLTESPGATHSALAPH
jgi:hypothetical protein